MSQEWVGASRPTVLIVEDEEPVRELLRLYLEKDDFRVETAVDGEQALEQVESLKPDLVLLDIMLPKLDGWTVCREIRKKHAMPVIMLTAKGEESDKVLGLEIGADDYITKPFSPREVLARVKVVLKRTANFWESGRESAVLPGLTIDNTSKEVTIENVVVPMRPKEFELLWLFARFPGRVFSRSQLLEIVWGYNYFGDDRTVDTHIKRLRKKLTESRSRANVRTVWGQGYKLEVEW